MGETSLESSQELFERLQATIGAERARLAGWQAIEADYQRKYRQELRPLEDKLNLLRYKLVQCFDHAHKNMGLSKSEREFVSELVTEFSEELLGLGAKSDLPAGCDAARLKTLYKKHSGSDYDADVAEESEQAKEYLAEALELDADELDAYTPIQLLQIISEEFEGEEAEELLEAARQALRSPVTNAQAWQALQDAERERLAESAGAPAAGVDGAGLTGEALDKANAVLVNQLDEVLAQLTYAEEGFKLRYELDPFASFDPETVIEELDADIVDIQEYIRELEHEVMQFSDESLLKAWLKAMRREVAAIERREGRS